MRGITKRFPGVLANDAVDFEAARRRGARAARRERRRQEHALEHPHRPLPAGRGRDQRSYGEPVQLPLAERRDRRGDRHGAPALPARPAVHGRREHRPRRAPRGGAELRRSTRDRSSGAWRSSASATGSRSTRGARIWQLSVGEQQRVEILKALYREARILILDEPTAVLTPQESEALFATLRTMAEEGRTVIFISHKLHEVKAVADRVTVLRGGRNVATVATADATLARARRADGRPRGRARPARRARPTPLREEPALEVDGLSVRGDRGEEAVRGMSFTIRAGEIVGVAGVAGNGQRELAEAITGMRPVAGGARARRGAAAADGRPARGDRGRHRARPRGPARHRRRAEPDASRENSVLKSYRRAPASRGPLLRLAHDPRASPRDLIERYDVRRRGRNAPRARPLRRQPAEARARPRVLRRAEGADRRVADARARRRRDRDRARVPARGGRARASRCC